MINKNTNKKLCTWKTCKMITFYAYIHLKYNFIEGFWNIIGLPLDKMSLQEDIFSACFSSIWFSFAIQYISVECWLIKIFHFFCNKSLIFFCTLIALTKCLNIYLFFRDGFECDMLLPFKYMYIFHAIYLLTWMVFLYDTNSSCLFVSSCVFAVAAGTISFGHLFIK